MTNQEPKHWNNLTEEEQIKRKLLSQEGLICVECGKDITSEEEQKKIVPTNAYTCWECWEKSFDPNEEPDEKRCINCCLGISLCECGSSQATHVLDLVFGDERDFIR